jgi:NADH-quinone oxidoreductase subunit J
MGAMVLAHREHWTSQPNQKDLSVERFRRDGHPGNLPNPGVYARHNAVDTPALLPDGTPLEESIPAPVRSRSDARPVDHADVREVHEIAEGKSE